MLDASPTAAPHAHARSTLPRGAVITAALLTVTLAVAGGGYGFHRDELYFIEAGLHQAWGYPDQPAAAPLLAAGWHRLVGGPLWAFRLLPAVLAGLIVLVAAATSAQLGGTWRRPGHHRGADGAEHDHPRQSVTCSRRRRSTSR